jgi:dTDP-4-amino-4,6-dideoxygalactose transaminase
LLRDYIGCQKALLTHSCTAALEMAAMLIDIKPGDEVIMPSYTFVSTANAFVLRGGVPVFVDIRPDTLNIDEEKIEAAITSKTKAICVVHYAGVACDMDKILSISEKHNLFLIEDAAQAIGSEYKNKKLGSFGHLSAVSFHETKNIQSGEGGALLINDKRYTDRAEILREKGTDRSRYFRNEVDKYTWVDIGSSYLPSELVAAYLYAQLEKIDYINSMRLDIWNQYQRVFNKNISDGVSIQSIPEDCMHNAHMFYILFNNHEQQSRFLDYCKNINIAAVFHYIPLHTSYASKKYCKTPFPLEVTEDVYNRIVRLPLWPGLDEKKINYIGDQLKRFLGSYQEM